MGAGSTPKIKVVAVDTVVSLQSQAMMTALREIVGLRFVRDGSAASTEALTESQANEMFDHLVHSGFSHDDMNFVELAQAEAKKLLFSITVKGSYNLAALRDAANTGKILDTLSGQTVSLRMDGNKLMANGVEVLNNEAPASNGWVIATNGLVNKEE